MNLSLRNLFVLLTIVAIMPLAMVGCKKKGNFSSCKTDVDCRMDASGKEINGVCIMGKCEECAKDEDCMDGTGLKQCVNNRCLSSCTVDTDCAPNSRCENNFCIMNCTSDENCPGDQKCMEGRCMAQGESADANAWSSQECHNLGKVQFDFDRYMVKPEYQAEVKKLAECMKANPGVRATISGHCDERGTPSYNMALGERRAKAVEEQLMALGIAASRISTVSFGDQQPLLNEKTEYAWQQNRRAEFVLGK